MVKRRDAAQRAIAVMTAWASEDDGGDLDLYYDTLEGVTDDDGGELLVHGLVSLCGFLLVDLEEIGDETVLEILQRWGRTIVT
jgi:hypothetical protein